MRAVNLVPPEARQGGLTPGKSGGAVYGVIGGLALILLLLSVAAMSKSDRAEAEAQLAQIQQSTQQYSAIANQYAQYKTASEQATQRIATVRELSNARFDWAGTLRELSRVVPQTARLDSIEASVKPGLGNGGSAVRAEIPSPAISMSGCTASQATAADLMTRLQAMRRVTNVTLERSEVAASGTSGNCKGYSFELTVFYAGGDAKAAADIGGTGDSGAATPPTTTTSTGGGE